MGRGLSLIVCCFILTGCAATQRAANPGIQSMQSRIDSLEDEMNTKEREIGNIQSELRQVKQECVRKYADPEISARRVNNQATSTARVTNDESEEIIRVDGVSADKIQLALKRAGFYQGALDGKIGTKTKEAIKAFQKENNLKADGIVGRGTWTKLKNNL